MNKMKCNEQVKKFKIKFLISIFVIDFLAILFLYFIMPTIQNFPPLSENFAFQEKVQVLTHVEQYSIILLVGFFIHWVTFNILIKNISRYLNKYFAKQKIEHIEIMKVRSDCLNIPYQLSIFQLIAMLILSLIFNFVVLAQPFAAIKFTLATVSISSIIAILLLIVCQKFLSRILDSTYIIDKKYEKHNGYRIKNSLSLQIQMTPFIAVVLVLISLIGYSMAMDKQGDAISNYYEAYINAQGEISNISEESLKKILEKIPLKNENDYYYIIAPNNDIYVSKDNGSISQFVLDYKEFFYKETNGRLYEQFGVDEQLYAKEIIDLNGNIWCIGFKFKAMDYQLFVYYLTIDAVVLGLYVIMSYIWAKNISRNSDRISKNLKDILESNNVKKDNIIPIMSNDELGDLSYYYNKIQEKLLNQQNIITLQSKYNGMESNTTNLAHVIGNDASTIDSSISLLYDNDIRNDDTQYKRILDNMNIANNEIRKLVSNMSEQFKMNNDNEKKYFKLGDMLKELSSVEKANMDKIGGKINILLDNEITIYGVESKLYLALGNIIKNARLTYTEKNIKGDIDINVAEDDENINISIKDTAGGIPEEIQKGLFKEMLTTRGAKGSGLGLFLTGMNIRVVFNGQISYDTEIGKGTIFYITIPKNKNKAE